MRSFQLTILGMEVSFRAKADELRIQRAKAFVEEQYGRLKRHGGEISREKLLTLLVLGIADDLLESQQQMHDVRTRVSNLLQSIEETV